jgi:FRG domain
MRRVELVRWDEFLATFGKRDARRLFRGESKAYPSLTSRFRRAAPDSTRGPRLLEVERATLLHFQRQAAIHLPAGLLSRLEFRIDWWTIMQHYGAPTRLLDWTRSAFVASYFAVENHPVEDGVVWSVDVETVRDLVAARFNDRAFGRPTTPEEVEPLVDQAADEGILLFPEPSVHTDRMAAQQTSGGTGGCMVTRSIRQRIVHLKRPRLDTALWSLLAQAPDQAALRVVRQLSEAPSILTM